MTKRPVAITLIAWLFILVGAGTLIGAVFIALLADSSHMHDPLGRFQWHELLAIGMALAAGVGGVLLLKRNGWGRWLILAWLVFHAVISYWHTATRPGVHIGLALIIGALLLLPNASAYLRGGRDRTA
jgi:phosphatidylglycerophosphate synthase